MDSQTFEIGNLVTTRSVADHINKDLAFSKFVADSYARYINCDWGEISDEDKQMNDRALKNGDDRIFASYKYPMRPNDTSWTVWFITDEDKSVTTIMLPTDY